MEKSTLTDIKGVGKAAAERLREAGFLSVNDIASADPKKLRAVSGFTPERAQSTIDEAKALIGGEDNDTSPHITNSTEAATAEITAERAPVQPEGITMTTDTPKDKAAPAAKAEAPKAETKAKAAPAKKAPAKKASAKKAPAKAAVAKAPAKKTPAQKAPAQKSPAKAAAAKPPVKKPEPKAAPKAEKKTEAAKPANSNTPGIFKEPGYAAAGVLLVLAAYGFAQQPSVQEFLGLDSITEASSTTASAMTAPAAEAADDGAVSRAPAAAASSTGAGLGTPVMPSRMGMAPGMGQGMRPGMMGRPDMDQATGQNMGPYGNMPMHNHPGFGRPIYGGPMMGGPAQTAGAQEATADNAPAEEGQQASTTPQGAPMPPQPFGPYYGHPAWGNNAYNSGYGNGYGNGQGYGDGNANFDMNFAGRANTQASGSGYNGYGYNGYNGWNGYNGPAPYGYGPYGYGPAPRPMAPPAPAEAPAQ